MMGELKNFFFTFKKNKRHRERKQTELICWREESVFVLKKRNLIEYRETAWF